MIRWIVADAIREIDNMIRHNKNTQYPWCIGRYLSFDFDFLTANRVDRDDRRTAEVIGCRKRWLARCGRRRRSSQWAVHLAPSWAVFCRWKMNNQKNNILSAKQDDNLIYLSRWQAIRWHLYVYADISGKCLGCGVVRNTAGSGRGRLGVDYIQFLYSAFLPAFVSRFVFLQYFTKLWWQIKCGANIRWHLIWIISNIVFSWRSFIRNLLAYGLAENWRFLREAVVLSSLLQNTAFVLESTNSRWTA